MRKIDFSAIFTDETESYEVKLLPFIIKLIASILALVMLYQLAESIPYEIRDSIESSGKEYYISIFEDDYVDRKFDELFSDLNLYDSHGEDYAVYWEMVNGYEDYVHYMNYKAMAEEKVSLSYEGEYDQPQEISFAATEKAEEYRKKVLANAENIKYERNRRYLTEFAQKAQQTETEQ